MVGCCLCGRLFFIRKGAFVLGHLFNLDGPFSQLLSRLVDIMILNILFILFCLPLFTVGASITALYSVLLKVVRDEEKNIVQSFFIAFKRNFTQSTIIWFVMVASGLLLLANFLFLGELDGVVKFFFVSMIAVFGFVYLSTLLFIFPYIARYEDTIKRSLINSLLIGISNFRYLVILLLVSGGLALVVLTSSVGLLSGIYIGTFGGFAILAFLKAYLFRAVFSKYEVST